MQWINAILGVPLGYVMYFCYQISGSYAVAIALFALVSKAILFPLALSAQKNSIKLVRMKPALAEIKARCAPDKDKIAEEQLALYKRAHYSPTLGCLPTFLQFPLIIGLILVLYNPLQHLLHLDGQTISALVAKAGEIMGTTQLGSSAQMVAIRLMRDAATSAQFSGLAGVGAEIVARVAAMDFTLFGLNLTVVPRFDEATVVVPILAGLSAWLLCLVQNRLNAAQREQGRAAKWGMTAFMVAFSLYFSFVMPAGIGFYWFVSNLLGIAQVFLLNRVYDPDAAQETSQ